MQVSLPNSYLFLFLLQCDIWFRHVSAEGIWGNCVYSHHAVQNGLGRVHEGSGGMGYR